MAFGSQSPLSTTTERCRAVGIGEQMWHLTKELLLGTSPPRVQDNVENRRPFDVSSGARYIGMAENVTLILKEI
jgi:hypothetical protein